MISTVAEILGRVAQDVWLTVLHNWPFLLASVVVASVIQVYVGTDRLAGWMRGRTRRAVVGAVGLGALTPFCSCGTTAVVLGAMASAVPWAPLVAFMVSSPLTSPGEYVLSAGLFGPAFATTFFVAAIVIGLASGAVTVLIERTGLLDGQARMQAPTTTPARRSAASAAQQATPTADATPSAQPGLMDPQGRTALAVLETPAGPAVPAEQPASCATGTCCTSSDAVPAAVSACGDGCTAGEPTSRPAQLRRALVLNGRRLALYFLAFAGLGYLLIEAVPTQVLTTYLGGDSWWSVPLAALIGIPVYLNTDGSLPLVASLMDGGMSPGAALAFLVTGAGTSIGAVTGMLVIARWRVVALVIGSLFVGALVLGYLAPLWL